MFAQNDLKKVMKFGEALLLDSYVNSVSQSSMKDSSVTALHSIKTSFMECCGPDYIYTPIFHEATLEEVIVNNL